MERLARTLMVWLVIWGTLAPPVEAGPLGRIRARVRERRGTPAPPAVAPTAKPWTAEQGRQAVDNSLARVSGFSGGSQATTALSQLTDDVRITGANAPSNGNALVYESASSTWKPGSAGGGVTVDGTLADGDSLAYDATDTVYVPVRGEQNVKNFANGKRAAGTAAQTTATITATQTTATAADAATWEEGHGAVLVGAGANHSLAAPSNTKAIPVTVLPTVVNGDETGLTAIDFTMSASTDRLLLNSAFGAPRPRLQVPDGQGVRFSNQGGALPTYTGPTAFTETTTTYFLRNAPEVGTYAISGTPTGGTIRWIDGYTANYVDVAYNASSATLQAALRTLPGFAQITISEAGSTPNYTHTITFTGVPGDALLLYDFALTTGGTPLMTISTTTAGGWTVHDTAAHAIANTNAYDIVGTGSGTHYLQVYGDRTWYYQVATQSGKGGYSAGGTEFTTAIGPHELSRYTPMLLVWDDVTNAEGYLIYGDTASNKKLLMPVDGYTTLWKITLQAGGFTSPEFGDIGRTVSDGTSSGRLVGYDASNRILYVDRDTTLGSNGATITISGGTGGGTQTGATVAAFGVYDWGNDKDGWLGVSYSTYSYLWNPRIQRRCGEQIYPGQLMETGGNLYTCTDVYPVFQAEAAADRKTMDPVAFTINTTTNVVTTASATSIPTATAVYLQATVALPTHTSATRFTESTPVYVRQASSTTYTFHPTANDATNNTNTYDLIADGVGTYYVLMAPTFNTTTGRTTIDDRVRWRREDQVYPVTVPASAVYDALFTTVVSKSGSDLTFADAATTSVTSQLLLHDDTSALIEHWNVVKGSSAKSKRMFLPKGDYPLVTRKMSAETRFYNHAFGSALDYSAFRWVATNNEPLDAEWVGEPGTRVIWQALDNNANDALSSTEESPALHTFGNAKPVFRDLFWCYWPKGVAVCEHRGAVSYANIFSYDVDATSGGGINDAAHVDGPKFFGGGFLGWANLGNVNWGSSPETQEEYHNFSAYYGGSNADPGFYTNGGLWDNVKVFGIRAERSMGFYQDNARGIPMTLRDCYLEGFLKDGLAVRYDQFKMFGGMVVDVTKIFARENTTGFLIDGTTLVNTVITPHNSGSSIYADDVSLAHLKMIDSAINVETGCNNVVGHDLKLKINAYYRRYDGTASQLIAKGTDQVWRDVYIDNRGWDGLDSRSMNAGGDGKSVFDNVNVIRSEGTSGTLSTSGSGPKWFTNCYFWSQDTGGAALNFTHTGDTWWINPRFAIASNSGMAFASGGRTEISGLRNATSCTITIPNTITGPTYIHDCMTTGAFVIQEPSTNITDNNFGGTITISSATNLIAKNNRVSDSLSQSPSALASGSTADYAIGPCDIQRLDPNAANSTLTGIVARGDGCEVTIINVDAGTATITLDEGATASTDANEFDFNGTDAVIPVDGSVTIIYDGTAAKWKMKSKTF